jgi:outer membrane protein assembly factor BamB
MLCLPLLLRPLLGVMLLTSACSPAEDATTTTTDTDQPQAITQQAPEAKKGKKGGHKKGKGKGKEASLSAGLRQVGHLTDGILESSGLCAAPEAGTYFTFGDDGQQPIVYRVDATGQQVDQFTLGAPNHDWESLSRDNSGNYYMGDCGNNNSDRRNLAILRFRPAQPNNVGKINFSYPDQTEFPPSKSERNFDCEASLWHDGQVYLFTKDRAQSTTCKVYTVPETPGTYKAKLITKLAIRGQVTDATLSPNGRRLVLLARQELFIFDGNSWDAILKATPRHISLKGAGQTEGAAFKNENTLLITTEQGAVYELAL